MNKQTTTFSNTAGDSMNNQQQALIQASHDLFGQKIAMHLNAGSADLPHDLSERLRVARQQAVAKRKRVVLATASTVQSSGGAATMTLGGDDSSFWGRFGRPFASFLPLLALVVGLIAIADVQGNQYAQDLAELDADMLTDTLPASAYVDPGFAQFLKLNTATTSAPAAPAEAAYQTI